MAGPKSANFLHTSGQKSPRKIIVRVLEKYVRLVALTYASPKVNVTTNKLVPRKERLGPRGSIQHADMLDGLLDTAWEHAKKDIPNRDTKQRRPSGQKAQKPYCSWRFLTPYLPTYHSSRNLACIALLDTDPKGPVSSKESDGRPISRCQT